jgi:predicted nucleotidyltransferase
MDRKNHDFAEMDKTDALNIVKKYAEIVKRSFDCQKIILFGSYAKDNARKDSDIDIAIIFSDYDNRLDRQVELMKLTRQIDTRIEPHKKKEKDFNQSNPFVYEIVSHGMEIES